jgi:hypothetical protein
LGVVVEPASLPDRREHGHAAPRRTRPRAALDGAHTRIDAGARLGDASGEGSMFRSRHWGSEPAPARAWRPAWFGLSVALCAPAAAGVLVYDDVLQNGFVDYSYVSGAGSVNLASMTHVHGGTVAVAFTAGGYDAFKVANNTTLFDTATAPRLQLWFYGTQAQCQGLDVILERNNAGNDETVASGALADYAGNCAALVAGQWFEIDVDFTVAPLAYEGTFDRISLFNHAGTPFGPVWFDDLVLQSGAVDMIFKNGFEGDNLPPPACGMSDEHDVSVLAMASDRFGWCDAAGQPRTAVLAHNDGATGPGGTRGGELRQFSYRVGADTRTANASGSGASGFGYVVSHPLSEDHCVGGDSSSLGHFFPGTWTRVFEGRHHAIFRFQQNYPRYCSTAAPAAEHDIAVTIDWIFASGRDDPLWSITYDMSAFADGTIEDDSRAPYGELLFDGSANEGAHSTIAGVAWGDQYKFTSTTNPVTLSSAWTWNQPNTIPYVKLWTTDVDATMGSVSTQTIAQKDVAGYFDVVKFWGHSSADNLTNCNDPAPAYTMPCIDFWPYQSINFSFGGANVATNNTRLAWGTEYGFLGQSGYHIHGSTYWGGPLADVPRVGWPKQSYSLYVVLGSHATDAVAARVAEVEARQSVTLGIAAGIGSVATSGPAGINRADTVAYSPAGYDPVYGALTFNASANALDATIGVGAGTLKHPLLIVRNYTSATYPATLKWNGATLAIDVDWLPSLRPGANELWITLNRDVSGAGNELQILP